MLPVILILSFISILMGAYLTLGNYFFKKDVVTIRLANIGKKANVNESGELSEPLVNRFVKPMLDSITKSIMKAAPSELLSSFEKKIKIAGKPFGFGLREWINFVVASAVLLPLFTFAAGYYMELEIRKIIFVSLIEISLILILPQLLLRTKAKKRQKSIIKSMPDALDLLMVSVEAGLAFDGALQKVAEKMHGPLAAEFENVLQEIKVGKQKKDALKDMADRVAVQDLTTFIGSVVQADQFGVSIVNVLRIQAEQMRQRRKQRAQEKAMKAPIKMLIPMMLFIFPTIFAVLLGPILIKVIEAFS
ncbi:MAG: type II secretion system F family protein [Clostridiales bacterium]|nr:type II secretion system F family protein [Clostridiales bacterium]